MKTSAEESLGRSEAAAAMCVKQPGRWAPLRCAGGRTVHIYGVTAAVSLSCKVSQRVPLAELNRLHLASSLRRAKWMPPWPSSKHLIVLCSDMSRKDSCRGAPLMCHLFAITWQLPLEGGGREEGIIWFHLHLFTWTPWANGNHFHFKAEKGVKRFGKRELNCDGTPCVKVCVNTPTPDLTVKIITSLLMFIRVMEHIVCSRCSVRKLVTNYAI